MSRTSTGTWTRARTETRVRFTSIRTNLEKATRDGMWSPQPSRDQSPGAEDLVLETMKMQVTEEDRAAAAPRLEQGHRVSSALGFCWSLEELLTRTRISSNVSSRSEPQ